MLRASSNQTACSRRRGRCSGNRGLRGRVVMNGNVVAQSALDRLHRREFRPRLAGYEGQGPVVAVERDAHEDLLRRNGGQGMSSTARTCPSGATAIGGP